MALLYKPDWEEAKERYRAWWAHDAIGRCAMWVTAKRNGADEEVPPVAPSDPVQRWTDLDYIAELNDFRHRTTFYGGEAFPAWSGGAPGHTNIPTLVGCPIHLDMRTGWQEPLLTGEDWTLDDIQLDRNGRWYQFTLDLTRRAAEEARGRSIPSIPVLRGCGDMLATIRGSERLLLDVMDRPDLVRRTEFHLVDIWAQVYDVLYDIVSPFSEGGSTAWFPVWAPGRSYPTSCDFSYMISPDMFAELFLPAIERQLTSLDYAIHHVDGIGSFNQVPLLCELPRLQALQILPGAGKPSPLHYMDVLKDVQARGKNLHISVPPGELEAALTELSSRGLFIHTWAGSEMEARKLLKDAAKWSHD